MYNEMLAKQENDYVKPHFHICGLIVGFIYSFVPKNVF